MAEKRVDLKVAQRAVPKAARWVVLKAAAKAGQRALSWAVPLDLRWVASKAAQREQRWAVRWGRLDSSWAVQKAEQ